MRANGLMGSLYHISEWVMRFLVTNLLWLIFNLPIVYLAVHLIIVENISELVMVTITIAVLMPFIFFPVTVAMFAVTRKWVMKEIDIPIIRSFWSYYKENYLRSMLGGLILGMIWIIYVLDYYYFMILNSGSFSSTLLFFLSILFLIVLVFLVAFTFNFISYTVHIHERLFKSVKDTLIISIGSPLISLSISGVNVFIVYISFSVFTFLIPFFMGSLIAFVSFRFFNLIYLKVTSLQKENDNEWQS